MKTIHVSSSGKIRIDNSTKCCEDGYKGNMVCFSAVDHDQQRFCVLPANILNDPCDSSCSHPNKCVRPILDWPLMLLSISFDTAPQQWTLGHPFHLYNSLRVSEIRLRNVFQLLTLGLIPPSLPLMMETLLRYLDMFLIGDFS